VARRRASAASVHQRFFHTLYFQVRGSIGARCNHRAIGDNPSRLAALKTNAVQASVFTTPTRAGAQGRFCLAGRCLQVWDLSFKAAASPPAVHFCATIGHRRTVCQRFFGGVAYAKNHKEDSLPLIKEFMKLRDQDEVEDSYQGSFLDVAQYRSKALFQRIALRGWHVENDPLITILDFILIRSFMNSLINGRLSSLWFFA